MCLYVIKIGQYFINYTYKNPILSTKILTKCLQTNIFKTLSNFVPVLLKFAGKIPRLFKQTPSVHFPLLSDAYSSSSQLSTIEIERIILWSLNHFYGLANSKVHRDIDNSFVKGHHPAARITTARSPRE